MASPSSKEPQRTEPTGPAAAAGPPRPEPTERMRRPDLSGRRFGDFRLLRRLGSGGMGDVYLAEQLSLKRPVALKVLRPDMTANPTWAKRFELEAAAAAKLNHAHIVQIYAFGRQDELTYMALEYVPGMNLRQYVVRKGPLSARAALKIVEQVAAALHRAAALGVVHRDIKPDNILLAKTGEAKVADFGLARLRSDKPLHLTSTGVTMGTPLYMSPEQVEGKELDPRSDLYSLGASCYYMLTGQPPFSGQTAMAVAVQHVKAEPEPLEQLRPDLPASLCRLVRKLMAKDPAQRYQTGREVVQAVQQVRAELAAAGGSQASSLLEPSSFADQTALWGLPPGRRRRRLWDRLTGPPSRIGWLAASLVGSLLLGAGYGWYRSQNSAGLAPTEAVAGSDQPPAAVALDRIRVEQTAAKQYEYAELVGTLSDPEAAWMAVIERFPNETEWVRRARFQLGWYYLREGQLQKAQQFFTELCDDRDRQTRVLGQIGLAAVAALSGQTQRSLEIVLDVVRQDRKTAGSRDLFGLILWTLERNERNVGHELDLPDELTRWINQRLAQFRPPPAAGRGPGPARRQAFPQPRGRRALPPPGPPPGPKP